MSAVPVTTGSITGVPLGRAEAPRQRSAQRAPALRLVRAPATSSSRLPFVAMCVAILVGALLAALALNTAMASTSYTIRERQQQLNLLTHEEQRFAALVNEASAPEAVISRAIGLGMVASEGVHRIRLADGSVIGTVE